MAAPTLAGIPSQAISAGAPLHIALDGFDADGDPLTYSASVVNDTNAAVSAVVSPQTNRSLRITMQGYGAGGADGVMELQLFEDLVPGATRRIIELTQTARSGQPAGTGFYDGLTFHRIDKEFMIQGGDPLGNGSGGSGVDFDDEFHPSLMHTSKGILSMAKGGDDTNDSQFFVTNNPARHLDFNHTVFGFLTKGDDVRNAIANVAVTDTSPNTPVVMKSVRVFTDTENGVLRLSVPEGATSGNATVTVTVTDSHGESTSQQFTVTVQADADDAKNAYPYLLPVKPVHVLPNLPVQFYLSSRDVEKDAVRYEGEIVTGMSIQVGGNGLTTILPGNAAPGVYGFLVNVRPETYTATTGRDPWDNQIVPLYVHPFAPTLELLATSDNGASSTDRITSRNNNGAGNALSFRVSGVQNGAEVRLFADGRWIGQAFATSNSVVVTTNGRMVLSPGQHTFTARQFLRNLDVDVGNVHQKIDLGSEFSAPVTVTIQSSGSGSNSGGGTQPPAVTNPTLAVPFQPLQFSTTFSGSVSSSTHTATFDWGDGTAVQAGTITGTNGSATVTGNHEYKQSGQYTVTIALRNGSGQEQSQQKTVQVERAIVAADHARSGFQALYVGGSSGADNIALSPDGNNVRVALSNLGFSQTLNPPTTSRVYVYAGDGDDVVGLAGRFHRDGWIYGGAGNDELHGGRGRDMLDGGDGNDRLYGGDGDDMLRGAVGADSLYGNAGHDVLLGGAGADQLFGEQGDDLLVGSATSFDSSNTANDAALLAILNEWCNTGKSIDTRISNLTNGGGANGSSLLKVGTTVSNDSGAADRLDGGLGADWFVQLTSDTVSDRRRRDR